MMSLRYLGKLGENGGGARTASSYYENSADYYVEGTPQEEHVGEWIGKGAELLKLSGAPSREELQSAFSGTISGREVQRAGDKNRQMGFDLTFSAPKSVSLAWASATPELRAAIEKAHTESVKEAFAYLESRITTRRGKDGLIRERAFLPACIFTHHTSRAGDPQLHTHVVVPNFCVRADGSVGTIEGKFFFQGKMTAGALYQTDFSCRMRDLGYIIEFGEKGTFRLSGANKQLEEVYSKRADVIDALVKEKEIESYAATRGIVVSTREQKKQTDLKERLQTWRQEARAADLPFKVERLAQQVDALRKIGDIRAESLQKVTQQDSTFYENDFIREAARLSHGSLTAKQVLALTEDVKYKQEIKLIGQTKDERWLYTTVEMEDLEKDMAKTARFLARRNGMGVDSTPGIEKYPKLTPEQRQAVQKAATVSGVIVIQGRAGAGKTTALNAVRENYERAGWKIRGISVAGRAAATLEQETKIPSTTFASWRKNPSLDHKTVLVVDEAGLIGSRGMTEILNKVKDAGAKVILVGDERQLQPIDAGGALSRVDKEVCAANPGASSKIETIMRQNDPWMREVVSKAAAGATIEALQILDQHGKIQLFNEAKGCREELVRQYLERETASKDALIIVHHKSDARHINEQIRTEWQKRGVIGEDRILIPNRQKAFPLAVGDSIVFTHNNYDLDVRNGDRGVVLELDEKKLLVRLDNGGERTVNPAKYADLDYGWAVTTYKAQSATVDRAYVYGHSSEWMASQQATYVQVSRTREETNLFVVSGERETLVRSPEDQQYSFISPLDVDRRNEVFEQMTRNWSRDAAKDTTLDYGVKVPEPTHEISMDRGY